MLRTHKRLVDYSVSKRQLFGNDPFGGGNQDPGFDNPNPEPIGPNTPTLPASSTSTRSTTSTTSTKSTSTTSSSSSTSSTTSSSTSSSSSTSTTSTSTSTSSTLSSTSTSTSTSSKTSSTPAVVTPPPSTTSQQAAQLGYSQAIVTGHTTIYVSGGSTNTTGLDSSPSATPDSSSGISTAGIIGISAAAIVGIAILAGIIMWFVRRVHNRNDDFDANSFRRQSMALNDEDTPSIFRAPSGRPRPPTMIERHYANLNVPAPSPGFTPGHGQDHPYGMQNQNGYSPYQRSFEPGQTMPPLPPLPPLPPTPSPIQTFPPENPFYNPPTQSPMGSPTSVAPYSSAYNDQGQLIRQPSNGAAIMKAGNVQPVLTRQPSNGAAIVNAGVVQSVLTRSTSGGSNKNRQSMLLDEPHYHELNRTSVTPFQAAQYVAISRQLNVPPPVPLASVEALKDKVLPARQDDEVDHRRSDGAASPFADPPQPRPLVVRNATRESKETIRTEDSKHVSTAASPEPIEEENDDILPPKPAHMRIDSIPPVLPEIIHQRALSPSTFSPIAASFNMYPSSSAKYESDINSTLRYPSFPVSAHASMTSAFTSADTSLSHGSPPGARHVPPSPLAGVAVNRPETIYDMDLAYGGF